MATSSGTGGAGGGPVVSVACLLHPDSDATRARTVRESRRMAPSPAGGHPVELGPTASTDEDKTWAPARQCPARAGTAPGWPGARVRPPEGDVISSDRPAVPRGDRRPRPRGFPRVIRAIVFDLDNTIARITRGKPRGR